MVKETLETPVLDRTSEKKVPDFNTRAIHPCERCGEYGTSLCFGCCWQFIESTQYL